MENISMAEERLKKQNFLKNEVLQKGYDALDFQQFLESKRENGGNNIDLWDFSELKQLVLSYHKSKTSLFGGEELEIINLNSENDYSQTGKIDTPIRSIQNSPSPSKSIETLNKNLQIQLDSQKEKEDQKRNSDLDNFSKKKEILLKEIKELDYERTLNCQPLPETIINDLKPRDIKVVGCLIEEEGIFRFPYGIFTVVVEKLGFMVKRRMKDFVELAEGLKRLYPCNLIPPLPNKLYLKNVEKYYIEKKQKQLEYFLQELCQDKILRNTSLFFNFLSQSNNLFELKDNLKSDVNPDLQALRTTTGEIKMRISENLEDFHNKIAKYLVKNKEIYQRLNELTKQLLLDFDQLSSTLFGIGNTFAQLYDSSLDLSNNLNSDIFRENNDIFVNLNNYAISWGNLFSKQMQNIDTHLNFFLRQESKSQKNLLDLINSRYAAADDFYGSRNKTDLEKSSLEKIENVVKLKRTFAYFNQQIADETVRMFKSQVEKFSRNFVRFSGNESSNVMEFHVILADLLCNFDENQVANRKQLTIMTSENSELGSRRSSIRSSIRGSFKSPNQFSNEKENI